MATFRTHYKTIEHFGLQMFLISYRYDCPESEMTVFNTFQRYQQCILAAILVQYSPPPPPSSEFPMTLCSGGVGVFWNHTIHKNSKRGQIFFVTITTVPKWSRSFQKPLF